VPVQGRCAPAKFQVLVEPDGTTGSTFCSTRPADADRDRQPGRNADDHQWSGAVSFQSSVQLSPDAQKIISDVFSLSSLT